MMFRRVCTVLPNDSGRDFKPWRIVSGTGTEPSVDSSPGECRVGKSDTVGDVAASSGETRQEWTWCLILIG